MAVATFDTLKFADTLKAGGVPPAQAEAQARAMAEVIQLNFKELATKDDLAHLREDLRRDIADQAIQLSARLDVQVAKFQTDIAVLRWMVGLSITIMTGVAIRLFFFKL